MQLIIFTNTYISQWNAGEGFDLTDLRGSWRPHAGDQQAGDRGTTSSLGDLGDRGERHGVTHGLLFLFLRREENALRNNPLLSFIRGSSSSTVSLCKSIMEPPKSLLGSNPAVDKLIILTVHLCMLW